jgi:hypothetical protein
MVENLDYETSIYESEGCATIVGASQRPFQDYLICRTLDAVQALYYLFTFASLRGSCKRASSSNSLYK